jgi:hypothetical protein
LVSGGGGGGGVVVWWCGGVVVFSCWCVFIDLLLSCFPLHCQVLRCIPWCVPPTMAITIGSFHRAWVQCTPLVSLP